jgi:hypothetical protein
MGPIRTVDIEAEFVDLVKKQINVFKELRKFSATQQKWIVNGELEKLMTSLAVKGDLVQTIKQLGKKLNNLQIKLEKSHESADNALPVKIISDVRELSDLIESVLALENHNLSTLDTVSHEETYYSEVIPIK